MIWTRTIDKKSNALVVRVGYFTKLDRDNHSNMKLDESTIQPKFKFIFKKS